MMAVIQKKFLLRGALKAYTGQLGPYSFVNGACELTCTEDDMAAHARFIERNWQGVEDGKRDLSQEGEEPVSGDLLPEGGRAEAGQNTEDGQGAAGAPTGAAGGLPDGDGYNEKLRRAVLALNPEEDSHWTSEGKPAISALEAVYGSSGFTRADVNAAAPGYTRKVAKEDQK
jgi:hypothetical protein